MSTIQSEPVTVTVISYDVGRSQLVLGSLSKVQRKYLHKLLDASDTMHASGFQEVLAYSGRKTVVAMGGYWDKSGPMSFFQVTSFGGIVSGEWIHSHEDGVMVRPPKN